MQKRPRKALLRTRLAATLLATVTFVPIAMVACHEPEVPAPPAKRLSPLRAIGASLSDPRAERDAALDAAEAPRGPLTVGIVVDQLAAWVVEERLSELPKDGGFARLAREGTRVKRMEYAHAVTDTAPGHSALYTGRTPHETEIFGNEVFDDAGKRVSILRDSKATLVTAKGESVKIGSSPRALAVPTVAEAFLAAKPNGRVLSISWKDRGAILPAGHVKDRATVLWFDVSEDAFVTSTAFATELPPFVRGELSAHPASSFRAAPWTPLDGAWVAAHAETADDAPGEGDLEGLGTRFPHTAQNPKAMRATPASDAMILSLATAGLEDLTKREGPLLLLLSLSANDYVGHVFGPDSHEAWDELRRLDRALGELFSRLDARFGVEGWGAVLSADHGTVHTPETLSARKKACNAHDSYERPCAGVRMSPDEIGDRLRKVEPGVVGICDPWVFFRDDIKRDPKKLAAAEKKVEAFLAKEPGVARTFTTTDLAKRCANAANAANAASATPAKGDPELLAKVCASWSPHAGDVYVVAQKGAFFDPLQVVGKGVSHGSPYRYDRAVPLFVRRPGKVREGVALDETLPFTAFRASLEGLTGLADLPTWAHK